MSDQKFRQAYDALIERMPDPPGFDVITSNPVSIDIRRNLRSTVLVLALSLAAVLGLVGLALLIAPNEGDSGISGGVAECESPPAREQTVPDSDFTLTVTPNPVSPGGRAELVLEIAPDAPQDIANEPLGEVITGAVASLQCWNGSDWVETHHLFKDGLGQPFVESDPDVTITFPAVGLSMEESHTIVLPPVPSGMYRIQDDAQIGTTRYPVYALVEIAEDLPAVTTTAVAPNTSALPGTTVEGFEGDVGVVIPIDVGPLESRGGHSVIWTGTEMIVWGGQGDEVGNLLYADGAAFSPGTETWRRIADAPLSPRSDHIAAWTGDEMLVVGGVGEKDGAGYSPATDTWRTISKPPIQMSYLSGSPQPAPVWTGSQLVVWAVATDEVAAYNPTTDQWTVLSSTGLRVDNGALRWNGEHVYAFGDSLSSYPSDNDLLVVRLDGGKWQSLPSTNLSTSSLIVGAQAALTQWDGQRFLAWSGSTSEGLTKAFDPTTNSWDIVGSIPDPPCEGQGEPIQASGRIISFGTCGSTVSVWDPDTQSWNQLEATGTPTARQTIWTGEELINWGDTCCYGTGGEPFRNRAWRLAPW